ncbi:hypothetical protein Fcan01_25627 [Folsomia candida]|uniref:Uncharacterized protein n=1 Tax=Folsomia candida TaxID=158441 RepID=A0A226D3U7_FOLCA|nr:hypothetical protein Fcan01_25627 [Folsomia candida]
MGCNTPLGVVRLVKFLYLDHYPFRNQLPYRFSYRKGILHVEAMPNQSLYAKFVPPVISVGVILLSAVGIYYLTRDVDNILMDIRFWVWLGFIAFDTFSTFAYCIVTFDEEQIHIKVWEDVVQFDWHIRKGKLFGVSDG